MGLHSSGLGHGIRAIIMRDIGFAGFVVFCLFLICLGLGHLESKDRRARHAFSEDCRVLGGMPVMPEPGRGHWVCIDQGSTLERTGD